MRTLLQYSVERCYGKSKTLGLIPSWRKIFFNSGSSCSPQETKQFWIKKRYGVFKKIYGGFQYKQSYCKIQISVYASAISNSVFSSGSWYIISNNFISIFGIELLSFGVRFLRCWSKSHSSWKFSFCAILCSDCRRNIEVPFPTLSFQQLKRHGKEILMEAHNLQRNKNLTISLNDLFPNIAYDSDIAYCLDGRRKIIVGSKFQVLSDRKRP